MVQNVMIVMDQAMIPGVHWELQSQVLHPISEG